MAKDFPPKGPAKPGGFAPRPAARPTVGLPPSAGMARPTVKLPGGAMGGGFRPEAAAPQPPQGAPGGQGDVLRILQLGGTHLAAGRLDHAGVAAAAVLKSEPENPGALHLLGLAALGKGDAAQAEKLIAAAAARMPHHVNVWVNLGNAQRDQGKADEALLSYHRAEAVNPDYPDIFLNRGQLYQDSAQYAEAVREFERLIELVPDAASSYMRAAGAASDAGRFRDALGYCHAAMARLDKVPVRIKTITATTCERLGELDDAISWAEQALADDPRSGGALRTWSKARRRQRKNDAALLAELRGRLESADIGGFPHGEARLAYSELAQICDEQNDAASAFDYFTRMNAHTDQLPSLKHADRTKFINDVDGLASVFTKSFVKGWTSLPARGAEPGHAAPPVFLVGFPRSGTTLLDQILDAHPNVEVFEERPLLRAVRNAAPGYPKSLATMAPGEQARLRTIYWSELRKEGADLEGKTVVNKMPLDIVHAGLIQRLFPEARIIFALRHPADCVLSCFMQDFVPNGAMLNFLTLEGSARFYDHVMTLWRRYRQLLPLNVQEVRYENLVADLRAEVEPVLDFLDLDWDDAVSDPAAHALARGTIRTPSYSQVTQPIYSSSAERWRRYEKEMQPVLSVLKPHIEHFGYSL
ncbi:MAG: sulfotransferase [Parvibaculum sp.]|nr:sulfotransferase [Parvibaculum sp.]